MIRVVAHPKVNLKPCALGEQCLYQRRDDLPDGSHQYFSYVGPRKECRELGKRFAKKKATFKLYDRLDILLRKGKTFDEALTEMGL